MDDEEEVAEALAMVLRRDGHVVACAPSGYDAVEILQNSPTPDVVLTDLGMPDINGWEVARTAKERFPKTPVGLITGWGDDESLGTAVDRATVDFILAKPVDRRTLTAAIVTPVTLDTAIEILVRHLQTRSQPTQQTFVKAWSQPSLDDLIKKYG